MTLVSINLSSKTDEHKGMHEKIQCCAQAIEKCKKLNYQTIFYIKTMKRKNGASFKKVMNLYNVIVDSKFDQYSTKDHLLFWSNTSMT